MSRAVCKHMTGIYIHINTHAVVVLDEQLYRQINELNEMNLCVLLTTSKFIVRYDNYRSTNNKMKHDFNSDL